MSIHVLKSQQPSLALATPTDYSSISEVGVVDSGQVFVAIVVRYARGPCTVEAVGGPSLLRLIFNTVAKLPIYSLAECEDRPVKVSNFKSAWFPTYSGTRGLSLQFYLTTPSLPLPPPPFEVPVA